jgi:hypothetical protein
MNSAEEYLKKNTNTDVELQNELEMKPWHDDTHELAEVNDLEQDLPKEVLAEWHDFIRNGAKPTTYIPSKGITVLTQ